MTRRQRDERSLFVHERRWRFSDRTCQKALCHSLRISHPRKPSIYQWKSSAVERTCSL